MIYKYQCDAEYIGRTNDRLDASINQHVSSKIRQEQYENYHTVVKTSGSTITEHLIIIIIIRLVPHILPGIFFFLIKSRGHSNYDIRVHTPIYNKSKQPSIYRQLSLNVIPRIYKVD